MNNYQLAIDNDQLPEGYKQTEVGVIPEDWDAYYLHQVSRKITDGEHATPKRTTEGYYLLSARNVHNGRIDLTDVDFVGADEYQRIRKRCDPETGDVLISCSGTIGRVAVLPAELECVMVRSAALIKPDEDKTDSYFIQYVLQSRIGQIQIAQTLNQGAQANLFINHIEGLKVPFPPLPEQRSIATALSDVDALIASLDKLIAKKQAIKTATMQQLLTGKKRLPGFGEGKGYKKTAIDMIPEDWEVKRLKHISPSQSVGLVVNPSSYFDDDGTVPMLVGSQIHENHIDWESSKRISKFSNDSLPASRLMAGDLVTVRVGEPGVTAVVPPELDGCNCASMMIVRQHSSFSSLWLCYVMNSPIGRSQIEHVQYGTAQKQFNISDAVNFLYPVPPFEEQRSIATVLSDMDAEITALEARRAKTQAIKQGMMQELLTGRTRLV